MSNKSDIAQQIISLPKGGDALKGIGETLEPNLPSHTVYRYRPRTEGLFARIKQWINDTTRPRVGGLFSGE